jgi:ABC-type transport system involved in multi-copper enzyme maturation permease subunit
MKPLAILKDSLREAWDSKTLLVMLVLALLFLIGVASIGYNAAEPRVVVEQHYRQMSTPTIRLQKGIVSGELRDRETGQVYPYATYSVTGFRTLKEGSHPSLGEHEFTLLIRRSDQEKIDKLKEENKPAEEGSDVDLFERMVAAWHETSKGEYIRLKNERDIDPRKWLLIKPVTEEMIREFLSAEFERSTQVPIVALERLPSEKPNERVYKVTTGPSAEPRAWPVKLAIGFGAWESPGPAPLGEMLHLMQDYILSSIGGLLIILIAVIITSFFIPNMLRPGSVVMLLSKPIGRTTLLLFKYFGGLFFVLILSTFVVAGVWLITGIRSGIWAPGIFAVVPLMTLSFAILYAVSTAAAVLTRNSIVCILVTLAFAGLLWLVGKIDFVAQEVQKYEDTVATLKGEQPQYPSWTVWSENINRVLPRWRDIDRLNGDVIEKSLMSVKQQEARHAIERKHMPTWGGTLGVTGLWIAGLLAFSCWRFSTKDY